MDEGETVRFQPADTVLTTLARVSGRLHSRSVRRIDHVANNTVPTVMRTGATIELLYDANEKSTPSKVVRVASRSE